MANISPILQIQGLEASINDTRVIKGLNLTVNPGEIHAIMGKNGSGKSTFSKIVAGHSAYRVTAGNILFNGESILDTAPEERSQKGIFLGFQYPIEIPGVSNADFLSVSSTGMDGARGSNGSLPVTNFLKLATGSDLINAGTNVGYGTDVNWFPYQSTTRYVGRIF